MKWSCCEGGNVLLWENSESPARQMEGVARALVRAASVNSSSIIVSHILITFCTSHLVITCCSVWSWPVLVTICLGTSLKNNTRLSSVSPPPPHLETWVSVSFSLSPVSGVIVGFLFSSRQWCFRDHMILNSLPNRNVHLLKKPYQIFPKASVPRQNDHPWCRVVSYGEGNWRSVAMLPVLLRPRPVI